jgi:cell division protein FtsL
MVSYLITPLCITLLLCGIFGIVWLRSSLISLEYSISELEKKRLDSIRETKMLMAERSALLSMKKVEKTAMSNLGLVFPNRTKVVAVQGGSSGLYTASLDTRHYRNYDRKDSKESEFTRGGAL